MLGRLPSASVLKAFKLILLFVSFVQANGCEKSSRVDIARKYHAELRNTLKNMRIALQNCPKDAPLDSKEVGSKLVKQEAKKHSTSVVVKSKAAFVDRCENFQPIVKGVTKKIACFLGKSDFDSGITVQKIMKTKLCTDVHIVIPVNYMVDTSEITSVDSFKDKNEDQWKSQGVKYLVHIGGFKSPLDNAALTNILTEDIRTFANSLARYVKKFNYYGVYVSWYRNMCITDIHCYEVKEEVMISFLNELNKSLAKEGLKDAKIALETNIYPTLNNHQLVLSFVKYLLLVKTWPENRFGREGTSVSLKFDDIAGYYYGTGGGLDYFAFQEFQNQNENLILLELQTMALRITNLGSNTWNFTEIPSKEMCKIISSPGVVLKVDKKTINWPFAYKGKELLVYNEYTDVVNKVTYYTVNVNYHGVWMRDIWADDVENECGCGSFPVLRAANEAIGRSKCILPVCPPANKA